MLNCGCNKNYNKKCGCDTYIPEPRHICCNQTNISHRHYYGRPVHVNHARQNCCHSKPNTQHTHQLHCNCQSCVSVKTHHGRCCEAPVKKTVNIPAGTNGPFALFSSLECGTYTITRSENEENSSFSIDGNTQDSTVGSTFVVGSNAAGSVIMSFTEETASAGVFEIVKTGECV